MNAINEKIYLDLELHIINRKLNQAEKDGNEGFAKHLQGIYSNLIKQRKEINDYLISNGVKVLEVREIDDMFIEYPYYQKIMGGFKEGTQRLWRDAVKYKLKQRMSKYFGGE